MVVAAANPGLGVDRGCSDLPRLGSDSFPQCLLCQVGADRTGLDADCGQTAAAVVVVAVAMIAAVTVVVVDAAAAAVVIVAVVAAVVAAAAAAAAAVGIEYLWGVLEGCRDHPAGGMGPSRPLLARWKQVSVGSSPGADATVAARANDWRPGGKSLADEGRFCGPIDAALHRSSGRRPFPLP